MRLSVLFCLCLYLPLSAQVSPAVTPEIQLGTEFGSCGPPADLSASQDGKLLLVGNPGSNCADLFEIRSGRRLRSIGANSPGVKLLVADTDGNYVLSFNGELQPELADARNGSVIRRLDRPDLSQRDQDAADVARGFVYVENAVVLDDHVTLRAAVLGKLFTWNLNSKKLTGSEPLARFFRWLPPPPVRSPQ